VLHRLEVRGQVRGRVRDPLLALPEREYVNKEKLNPIIDDTNLGPIVHTVVHDGFTIDSMGQVVKDKAAAATNWKEIRNKLPNEYKILL